MPVALAHAFAGVRLQRHPEQAISAALPGVLAGLLQAMGLLRRALVVPGLAARDDVAGLALIHACAGLGLGEHPGRILTAPHVGLLAVLRGREGRRIAAILGAIVALAIGAGAMEGPVLAMGGSGAALALSAMPGYVGLCLGMVVSAVSLLRRR